jgi:hypothetical protein
MIFFQFLSGHLLRSRRALSGRDTQTEYPSEQVLLWMEVHTGRKYAVPPRVPTWKPEWYVRYPFPLIMSG